VQPVLCGSGREHIGAQLLLDAVCRYLPSPLDKPPVVGRNPKKDKEESRKPSPDEPLAALVFKIHGDEHGGLFYLRIYSGTLKANSRPLNAGKNVKEFATKIYHVRADPTQRDALDLATAGDIVAITGPKEAVTGDTLCDPAHPILLEPIRFAETVVSRSIEPESTADRAKMEQLLNLLAREDPTFRWNIDAQTGQTLISGMGVLHLEIKEHRLTDDFRLKVRLGKPLVSYRETFRRPVKVVGDAARRITTGAVTAKLTVQFERVKSEQPVTIINRLNTEKVTPLFAAVAEQSLRESLTSGQLGYPMMEVKATILDLEIQEGATNEVAVRAAAADAVHQALDENVILLEPIMRLEVTVPEEFVGAVTGDLNKRRAEITEMTARGKLRIVEALVPLVKMFDYTEAVRSLSQGRATPSMEPHSYREAPEDVLDRMLHPEKYL
jgi:elongation factor G